MFCPKCGKEISQNQSFCKNCEQQIGAPSNTPIYIQQVQPKKPSKKIGCLVAFFGVVMFGGIVGNLAKETEASANRTTTPSETQAQTTQTSVQKKTPAPVPTPTHSRYDGDCGITATAHLQSNDFINHPQLKIDVRNVSGKDIAAIQFYAEPYDVYGKKLSSIFTQERLYTDDLIPAGKGEELNYGPFMEQKMKSVKLYLYSVYYADGTEWGNRDASKQEALERGKPIHATFQK